MKRKKQTNNNSRIDFMLVFVCVCIGLYAAQPYRMPFATTQIKIVCIVL